MIDSKGDDRVMDKDDTPHLIPFGSFVLDTQQLNLSREQDGDTTTIRLSAAETRLLLFFLTHPGTLHSKETLLAEGWAGRPVSTSSLPVAIANLRRYLDTPEQEALIRTLPRQGYLFVRSAAATTAAQEVVSEPDADAKTPLVEERQEPVAEPLAVNLSNTEQMITAPTDQPIPLPRWQQRLLTTVMLVFIAILLLLAVNLSSNWISVRCSAVGDGTVCQTQLPVTKLPQPQAGETWLVIGNDDQQKLEGVSHE